MNVVGSLPLAGTRIEVWLLHELEMRGIRAIWWEAQIRGTFWGWWMIRERNDWMKHLEVVIEVH